MKSVFVNSEICAVIVSEEMCLFMCGLKNIEHLIFICKSTCCRLCKCDDTFQIPVVTHDGFYFPLISMEQCDSCCFGGAGPTNWNSLPVNVWDHTLNSLETGLKQHQAHCKKY